MRLYAPPRPSRFVGGELTAVLAPAARSPALLRGRRMVGALVGLLVVAPAAAALALTGFDGLYGQDPYAYYEYATGPLREAMLRLAPPPSFFSPPGYPLLVALVSLLVGRAPLAGQLVSIAAGGATAALTFALASELWPRETAADPRLRARWVPLLAAVLVAMTGQLWQSSIVVMSDTTGLAAATAGAWALARYRRIGSARWLVLAAAALAASIVTRWVYALVAIPFALYALLTLRRRPWRLAIAHVTGAALVAGAILTPVLAPALGALLTNATAPAPFATDLQVYSWDPRNALRNEFITADGTLRYSLPNGVYYALLPGEWFYFTPVLVPLLLFGTVAFARRRLASGALLVLGWAAVVYAFHAGAPWQNVRFGLAYLPPLALLVAAGAAEAREALPIRVRPLGKVWLVVGLALMLAGALLLTRGFIERKESDLATVRWVEAQSPAGARLLTFGITHTFAYYGDLETVELAGVTPPDLVRIIAEARPTLLLLDVAAVERQWVGRAPSLDYRWLRDGPGLRVIGEHGAYTLFRVGAGP